MKQLSTYISEKLVLNKDTFKLKYFPKTKEELKNIIKQLLEERKDDDVINLNDIDTSEITNMSKLFYETDIKNIDISSWDVSNVKAMNDMFNRCENLESIGDISFWDVSNLTSMDGMFFNCKELEFIGDISGWDVKNVEYMCSTFHGCKNLKDIGDLNKWDVSKVEMMYNMFYKAGIKNRPSWYE